MSFAEFQKYINKNHQGANIDFRKDIVLTIIKNKITTKIIKISHHLLNNKNNSCFEILEYNFLIDESFKSWLLEV